MRTSAKARIDRSTEAAGDPVVEHLFWVSDMAFAQEHGLHMPALCGHWEPSGDSRHEVEVMIDERGTFVAREVTDCHACVQVHDRLVREVWSSRFDGRGGARS